MRTSKTIFSLAAMSALTLSTATLAAPGGMPGAGSGGDTSNCWGVVSSQLAQVEGGIGDHTSSQSNPRLGLGNVARLFYDQGLISSPTVSALGSFLATLDEYDETVCPVQ